MPPKYQLCSKSTKNCKTGSLKPKIKAKVRKGPVRSLRSQIKRSGFNIDVSTASETIWLTCPSKQAEPPEKIYLRTSVPIKKLTKRNIDDTCLGRWRCDYCGIIENSYYLLQLHISTNCETGLSFNCEICDIEIKNFADFAVHHIEHEVNTKKECPICLCPNVNNIKEHVIVKSHVLTEINGFKFPDNLCSRNNLKREPVANSNVDGCSQAFMDQDSGPDVKDSGFSCGPQLSVIDSMPDFKMEHNFALYPAGALSEQSITTRVIVNDSEDIVPLCDKNMEAQDKTGRMLPNGFQTNLVGFSLDSMVDYNIKQSDAFSEISKTDILRFDDLEDSVPSSNEDSISVDANDSFLSNGPRQYKTDLGPDFETESDNAFQKPKAYLDQSISVTLIDEDWKDKDPSSNEDSISLNANDSFLSYGPRPSRTDLVLDFETESDSAVQMSKAYPDQSISAAPIVEGSDVDTSNFVKTQNIEVNSAPVSMDTILPLIPNQSKQDNQNQEIGLKDLDKECIPQRHVQKECLSMAQSVSPVQERPTLRRRETTNIYYELSDSDLDNSGNEVIKEKADESGGNYELDSKVIRTSEIVSDSRKESHVSAFREDGEWENKVFSCSFCGKTFKTKGHLNEHINTHTMEKVHTCTYCGKNFVRRSHLQDHERLHTNDRPFTCEFCGKTFRSSSQLNVHFRFHRHDKWYICEICGKSFFTSSSLKRHLKIHKNDAINYICEICGKSFLTSNLKRHLKIHKRDHINSPTEANLITAIDNDDKTSTYAVEENEVSNQNGMHQKKGFQCQICKKYFPTEYALRVHTSVHSKVYSCSLCPKSFTSKCKLLAHEKVHAGAVVFECPVCKKTLKAKSSLIDHIRIHNGERSFQCDICTGSFTKKSTLVTHMRIHSGERPCECQTCKKTFTTSSWLKAHERSHTDEDRFMCSLCERRFTTSSSLKVHMRSHTGACPFVCNYCGKAFTTSSSLRVHERSHSGLTPFKCRICKKAFTASGALKSHEKSHGSDFSDSFLCRFCDGSFKNLDDLKKHELTHQHKKRYHCKNCDEAFITMFELTRHVREDHGTEKFVTKDKEVAD